MHPHISSRLTFPRLARPQQSRIQQRRVGLWAMLWMLILPMLLLEQPVVYAESEQTKKLYLPVALHRVEGMPVEIEGRAKTLALALNGAVDDAGRKDVLLEILREVNVGVYTTEGAVVQLGAERAVGDFYLYDVQVAMMASHLGRMKASAGGTPFVVDAEVIEGDGLWGIYDLTELVNSWAELTPDKAFSAEELYGVLIEGVEWSAANRNDPLAFAPLLVRELGRTHAQPYDLLADPGLEVVRFDAAQWFLILADFFLPTIWEAGPIDTKSQLVALSNGILKETQQIGPHPCEAIGNVVSEKWEFGKSALALAERGSNFLAKSMLWIDGLHGSILAYGVYVYSPDKVVRGHYGHDGQVEPMTFRTKVYMVDDLPQALISCAWLAGVTLPPKGPIADVTVLWATEGLDEHGIVNCGWPCNSKTGADGIATLIFTPNQEPIPGRGVLVEKSGITTGIALYQSKHKNTLGALNQIFTPKSGETRWFVEFHRPPGWYGTVSFSEVEKEYLNESTPKPNGVTETHIVDRTIIQKQHWTLATGQTINDVTFGMSGLWTATLAENSKETLHSEGQNFVCVTITDDHIETTVGQAHNSQRSDQIILTISPDGYYQIQNGRLAQVNDIGESTRTVVDTRVTGKPDAAGCANRNTSESTQGTYDLYETGPLALMGRAEENPTMFEGRQVYELSDRVQTWTWHFELVE